jgi:hypothetical protein
MSNVSNGLPFRTKVNPTVRLDPKDARPPRSKREVAAFESLRAPLSMDRDNGAFARRVSRWKR